MATITAKQARFIGRADNITFAPRGGPEEPDVKETASQAYSKGDPIYYDSNGTIAVNATATGVTLIAGIALAAATGTTGASVLYRPIRGGDRYVMCLISGTTALTDIGTLRNIDVITVTRNLVIGTGTTNDGSKIVVRIIEAYTVANGYLDGDVIGDTGGRYIVEFPDQVRLQG